jgi:L-tartrate/succinate antiporter
MGRRTLTLGYAVACADLVLAPFTPSVTARSAGTIYPVIKNLPPLYKSLPNDPSMKFIGTYLMWTAMATACVTSTLFLTALAPNLLALELVRKIVPIEVSWTDWFIAVAPVGILLFIAVPLLGYWIIRPTVKSGTEVPAWAADELKKMGPLSRREILLGVGVVVALVLWIFGGSFINATTVAIAVIALMLVAGVFTWDDVTANKTAWNTLAWFATLVALAGGLAKVGFIKWLAAGVGAQMEGVDPGTAMIVLVVLFFVLHYMFASLTAHVTALLSVLLAVGATIPGMNMPQLAMLLMATLGIMGVISPFAAGQSPAYFGSGYLPAPTYWKLGAIFGAIFLGTLLLIGVPWIGFVMA